MFNLFQFSFYIIDYYDLMTQIAAKHEYMIIIVFYYMQVFFLINTYIFFDIKKYTNSTYMIFLLL
jgi:hypothetical protein